MTTARVLLLEAAGPESAALVETAVARGYQVHAATVPEHTVDDILGYARRVSADAVLTTNEYLSPLLAEICAALGLPGNDPVLAGAARNKAAMAQQFGRRGVTASHTGVLRHESELRRLAAADLSSTRSDYATVRFLTTPHPCRLAAVAGLPDHSPQVPIVRVRTPLGETVNGTEGNTGRLGSFMVVGPDRQRVDRDADHLLAQVRIEVEPFEPSAHSTDHCDSP